MNQIIKIENGVPVLDAETAANIAFFEKAIKDIKEQEEALKKAILEAMESNNIVKVETDALTISYVAPTDFESFDSKAFRKDHADLYDEYVQIKEKKAYIKVNVKKV